MSNRKKSKSGAAGGGPNQSSSSSAMPASATPSLLRTLSAAERAARDERHRDEMLSLESIFGSDYKLITDEPNQPIHFQIIVKPLPNEADAANHCSVLLDVMLTAADLPLLVVRKQKSLGDSVVEKLQQQVNAEAERLIAKGEEAIVYNIVTFICECIQEYNVAPRSFHEQMIEREQKEAAEADAAIKAKKSQTQQAIKEEKELLKKSIEAAHKKKEEALKQQQLKGANKNPSNPLNLSGLSSSMMINNLTPQSSGSNSSRSISASPASIAASPAPMLGTSPSFPPPLSLGASAQPLTSAIKSKSSKPSQNEETKSSKPLSNAAASKQSLQPKPSAKPPKDKRHVADKRKDKALEKLKYKTKHQQRELRESAPSDEEEESEDISGIDDEYEDDESEEEDDGSESENGSELDDMSQSEEEELFASPTLTGRKGVPGAGGLSDIDKLMAQIELRDAQAQRKKGAGSGNKKKKHQLSDSESSEHDLDSDNSQGLDDDDNEADLSPIPTTGLATTSWLRGTSGASNSDASSAAAAATAASVAARPALPYYSRFATDFDCLEMLGKGGFGEVYKVQNKVDKLFYAVKRIKLKKKNPAMNRKIVKEVSMIAMLHHRYIVRYYQAWIEGEEAPDEPETTAATAAAPPKDNTKKPPIVRRRSTTTPNAHFDGDDDDEDWLSPSHPSTMGNADSDDDDEDSDEDDSDDDLEGGQKPVQAGQQYLYIQMEYCAQQTLRDLIDQKSLENNMEDVWRLFRQLLEAIAYVHKRAIVHRDLKPANVFIALSDTGNAMVNHNSAPHLGSVKLGDFGLAVLSSAMKSKAAEDPNALAVPDAQRSVSDLSANVPNSLSRQDSMTECVGTHFYSAPEQRRPGGSYDHRVDMYSIGIIFFEMMYPFNSLMERALQLEEIRQTGKVPNEFLVEHPDRLNIIQIIESLLKHNPEERPTADQLLKSGLIPLKIEDEYVELALKSVSARDSAHHTRLLDILFSMPPDHHIDWTFDYLSVSQRSEAVPSLTSSANLNSSSSSSTLRQAPLHFHQMVQMKVFDTMSNIFRNHGAVFLSTPIVTPKSNIGSTKSNTALYLDSQGTIIKLPYTLTVPFARYIAQQSAWTWSGVSANSTLDSTDSHPSDFHFDLRRYDISKVYRKNIIGGRPKELYECDFDIVWSNPFSNTSAGMASTGVTHSRESRLAAREKLICISAEVIKLTFEVLQEFVPAIGSSFIIKVNHSDLFDAVLDVILAESHVPTKGKGASAAVLQAHREDTALLRRELCKLASSYALFQGNWLKSPMRRQLMREKKLSPKKIDLLGSLFQCRSEPGNPEGIFQKIKDLLFSTPEARHILNETHILNSLEFISNLFGYLKLLNHIDVHIVFDISICGKGDVYSGGLVFQALVPNTNIDLGTGSSNSLSDRVSSSQSLAEEAMSSGGAFAPSSSKPESFTQNAYETIALGGQYDNLIASYMPPSAQVPLSAVGVNFAAEKITNAVLSHLMKHSSSKSLSSNSTLSRRIKKSLYGGDLHSSNVLLFSSKQYSLLKERVSLANELWTDHIPCLYIHPPHLNISNLRIYAKEYMIRWLVIFRKNEFQENSHVQVCDLAHSGSNSKSSSSHENPYMNVNEVASYIRGRMSGKKEQDMASGNATATASSHAHSSHHSAHPHSSFHSKPNFEIKIIDASNMKSAVKNQVLTQAKRCLNNVIANANPSSFGVVAADLPFSLIRKISSAFYEGASALQSVIEESHAKQRVTCDLLIAYMVKKCGLPELTSASSKSAVKDKQAAALAAAAQASQEKVEILYIYSVPDRKADMILCT